MKKLTIRLFALAVAALITSTTLFFASCKKESNETKPLTATTQPKDASVEMMHTTYTNCFPASGRMCTAGGFGCLVMFPPTNPWGDRIVTFNTPIQNGGGETGYQMLIEFGNEFPGLDAGILGHEAEGPEPTLQVHQQLTASLNCQSINVINKKYFPVRDQAHPFGYVYVDCIVQYND